MSKMKRTNHPLHALLPKSTDKNCNYELRDKTEEVFMYQDFNFCRTKRQKTFLPSNIINILIDVFEACFHYIYCKHKVRFYTHYLDKIVLVFIALYHIVIL
jgi:hypothetical protein